MAKLQTLKQNTEPAVNDENDQKQSKESVSTQTPGRSRMALPLSSSNQTLVSNSNNTIFQITKCVYHIILIHILVLKNIHLNN